MSNQLDHSVLIRIVHPEKYLANLPTIVGIAASISRGYLRLAYRKIPSQSTRYVKLFHIRKFSHALQEYFLAPRISVLSIFFSAKRLAQLSSITVSILNHFSCLICPYIPDNFPDFVFLEVERPMHIRSFPQVSEHFFLYWSRVILLRSFTHLVEFFMIDDTHFFGYIRPPVGVRTDGILLKFRYFWLFHSSIVWYQNLSFFF